MAEEALRGFGVLVTRPRPQASGLAEAIEAKGGEAIAFPVLEIHPRHPATVETEAHQLERPDIVVFVSTNAVRFGLPYTSDAAICAIGPATAAAIEESGLDVAIRPEGGFDSEHLLDEPALRDVEGQTVRIIRGTDGRELLASALRERGATVEYLCVYERRRPDYSQHELEQLASRWSSGDIDCVTVMSVASLTNLLALLPAELIERLAETPLVTPAARVIKEAHNQLPGWRHKLADGPQAGDMVRAIIELAQSG